MTLNLPVLLLFALCVTFLIRVLETKSVNQLRPENESSNIRRQEQKQRNQSLQKRNERESRDVGKGDDLTDYSYFMPFVEPLKKHLSEISTFVKMLQHNTAVFQRIHDDLTEETDRLLQFIRDWLGTDDTVLPTRTPILTGEEELFLNKVYPDVVIQHPTHGGEYHANEQFSWIIRNEDPDATGFRVNVDYLSIERCCDFLFIPLQGCYFDIEIKTLDDGPYLVSGSTLNISFTSDEAINYEGFTITVSAVYQQQSYACPGHEKEVMLPETKMAMEIRHPEHKESYEPNEQYHWIIRSENPNVVGFEVTFDKINISTCCDTIKIEGAYCSYGRHAYETKTVLSIRGDTLNITWRSHHSERKGSGFIIGIRGLHELNKTQCYEYTCDGNGHCISIHYDDIVTWNESVAACEAEGARLVVIKDQTIQDQISNAFVYVRGFPLPWIGISGNSTNNLRWITGLTTNDYDYQNWRHDLADFEDPMLHCGLFYTSGWAYRYCDLKSSYICEKHVA